MTGAPPRYLLTSSLSSSSTSRRISSRAGSASSDGTGTATAGSGAALHGSSPAKSPNASDGSLAYAIRVKLTRCRGSRFSPSD